MEKTTSGSNNQHSFKWFEAHCQHPNGQTNTSTFVSLWVEMTVANIHMLQLAPISSLHFFVATARYPCFFYLPHPPLTLLLLFHQFPACCLCAWEMEGCVCVSVSVLWCVLNWEFVLSSHSLFHVRVVFWVMLCFYLCRRVSEWVRRLHEDDFCVSFSDGCDFISMWDAAYLRFLAFGCLQRVTCQKLCNRVSDQMILLFSFSWYGISWKVGLLCFLL